MVAPRMAPLGTSTRWLSGVASWVWKMVAFSTVPVWPATLTMSPTVKGRRIMSTTPAAMLDRESLRARPTARPAAPSTVSREAVLTPSWPTAATQTTAASP